MKYRQGGGSFALPFFLGRLPLDTRSITCNGLLFDCLTLMSLRLTIDHNMRLTFVSLCLALFLCSSWVGAPASAAMKTIHLTSNPSSIYADGRSICSISAEVRDGDGDIVGDGVLVNFATSLGIIDTSAGTAGGVARVMLRSGIQPGRAMVSAVLADGQAVSQIQVEFLAPGTKIDTDAYIIVSSDKYLAYASDSRIVDASGGATVKHRGLRVEADCIQLDIGRNLLRARAKTGAEMIRISRGAKSLNASLLSYDLNTLRGTIVTEGEDGKFANLLFNGVNLSTTVPQDAIDRSAFEFADLSATAILVKAKSITIRPKHDLQFKKAELYMEGDKAFRLPLYLIPMAAVGPAAGFQYFGVTSSGLKVDIPLYYSLTPSGTGAVRIRNQQGGWSRNSSMGGWGLDLEQSYATGSAEGRFTVAQVTRSDWGLNWDHSQDLGSGSILRSNFQFPAHRDAFGLVSFNKAFSAASLGVNLQGGVSRYTDPQSKATTTNRNLSSNIYLQTNPKKYKNLLDYSLLFRTSFANRLTTVAGIQATSAQVKQPPRIGPEVSSGVDLQMRGTPISFGPKAKLNSSLSIGNDWGRGRTGLSVLGNTMFTTSFGGNSSLGLGYSYTLTPPIRSTFFPTLSNRYPRHLLSLNYGLGGGRWTVNLMGTHALDMPNTNAYGDVGYQVSPTWRLSMRGNYQAFDVLKINPKTNLLYHDTVDSGDTEIGVGHMIGSQDVEFLWSRSLHRFRIEMGSLGF